MDDTSVPRRTLLTDAQRAALLAIPTDETTLIRHYTLSDEDRRLIIRRRRPDTRLGLALQLCALRYPGRLLRPGEPIPMEAAGFIAGQLDVSSEALGDFARRIPTRYEQLGALRQTYGFVDLTHPHRQELRGWLLEVALVTTDGVAVVAALAEEMRRRRIVVPGVTVLERLAAEVISTADNQVIKSIVGRLRLEQRRRLDVLCDQKAHERQSRFSWVREPPGVAGVTSFHALVDRLEAVRGIMLDPVIVADTPPARLRRLAREGRRYSAQALRKMSPPRRYAVLAATLLEVERDLTDAAVEMVDVLLGRALAAAKRRREEALAREADLRRDTFRLLVRLGEQLVAAHEQGGDLGCAVTRVTDWEHLNAVIDAAGGFVRADEADAIGMLGAEHSAGYVAGRHGSSRHFASMVRHPRGRCCARSPSCATPTSPSCGRCRPMPRSISSPTAGNPRSLDPTARLIVGIGSWPFCSRSGTGFVPVTCGFGAHAPTVLSTSI